mgnify:CR=1 FL=1
MVQKIIILTLILINIGFSIGLKALVIPQSAIVLATSNSGIGDALSADINPASVSTIKPYIGFSRNIWYGDLEGQKFSMLWEESNIFSQLSFESLKIDDIELRNEVASEAPLSFFGVYWYAFDISRSIDMENFKLGYKVKFNLSKLYTESMHGITLDFGLQKQINDNFSLGFVLKNFGKEIDKNLTAKTPELLGLGISYSFSNFPLKILSDVVSQDSRTLTKLSMQTDFEFVNLILGSTRGDKYSDIAFGLNIKIKQWSLIYGNLKHNNSSLGNPVSIEIRTYF